MALNNSFKDSLDIANRACAHCGVPAILSVDEASPRNKTLSDIYDKMRQFELRRNIWRFAKRKVHLRPLDVNSRRLDPQQWDSTATYLPGAIVAYENGDLWQTWVPENSGNEPSVSDAWEAYFGNVAVFLYDSTKSYEAGELVYKAATAGSFIVYLSLSNGNVNVPDTTTAYDATVTYGIDDLAYYSGSQWRSVIAVNTGNTPADAPDDWVDTVTYAATNTAVGSDGYIYASVGSGNVGNDPVTDDGSLWTKGGPYAWTRVPTQQASSSKWLPLYAGLQMVGPDATILNSGDDRNLFILPAGYLREARMQPKVERPSDDREEYGDYLLTGQFDFNFAFIADITKVTRMDPMFCEMLGLRLAVESVQKLTQSDEKKKGIIQEYTQFGVEARIVNAIEVGYTEPDEDDFVTVRNSGQYC